MKFIISIIAIFAMQNTNAQKIINKSFSAYQINEINIDSKYADIKVESYNGNEILIEATVNINQNMDNDSYYFDTEKSGDVFNIFSKLDVHDIPKRLSYKDSAGKIKVITGDDIQIESLGKLEEQYSCVNYGCQTDITLKIKVPENQNISVRSIYGDLMASGKYNNMKANITYGDIEIVQSSLAATASINLHSTYGHVDYSVPDSADIEFNLSTSYGEIKTDLDVTSTKNIFTGNGCSTGRGGKYTLNEGKTIANITATYDNIYLRGN